MNRGVRLSLDARTIALALLLVATATFVFINLRYERRIAASNRRSADLYARTAENRQVIAQIGRFRAAQRRVRSDLRRMAARRSAAATTAATLAGLDATARTYRVRIRAVLPGPEATAGPATEPLRANVLTIHVRGRFRNILRFLVQVPAGGVPIEIDGAQLAPTSGIEPGTGQPLLDATIHATVYEISNSFHATGGR